MGILSDIKPGTSIPTTNVYIVVGFDKDDNVRESAAFRTSPTAKNYARRLLGYSWHNVHRVEIHEPIRIIGNKVQDRTLVQLQEQG